MGKNYTFYNLKSLDFNKKNNTKSFDPIALQNKQVQDLKHYFELADKKAKPSFKAFKNDTEENEATKEELAKILRYQTFATSTQNQQASAIYYYHTDHLGSNEVISDQAGVPYEFHLTLPFGETMAEQRKPQANYYNSWKFTGKELDATERIKNVQWTFLAKRRACRVGGLYYFGARYYQPSWSVWLSVDPLGDAPANISWSPYTYVWNNPLNFIDPDGRHGQSTHTDEDGNVIAVYDDGDLGVYTHSNGTTKADIDASHSVDNTSANGNKIGETAHWDEFVSPETGKAMTNTQIQIGKSFDPIISEMSKKADGMGLYQIAQESRPGGEFDIKGPYKDVGGLLNGKYVTSRSAGNYLAGYNANNGVINYTTFQKLAGKLHKGKYSTTEAIKTVLFGDYIGSPPTYGEDIYQLRMSIQGWSDKGKTGSNIDMNQFKRTPTNGLKW